MKKILLINAHPKKDSFCTALADKYITGAKEAKHEIRILNLRELKLEEYIKFTHETPIKLSPDLIECQNSISWANHLVFVYPLWWATAPALLKLFLEVVLQSGFAFQYQKTTGSTPKWDKLLLNKSARVITTMDSPPWYFNWLVGDPAFKMLKYNLNFCGIKPVAKNYFGSVKTSSQKQRKDWLEKVYKVALKE